MKKGFTILEMLVVIMVIAILIGIALPRFKGMQDEGNIAKVKAELRTLQVAVESYYIHNSSAYPATLSVLTSASPVIVTSIPSDPFASAASSYGYTLGTGVYNKYYVIFSVGTSSAGTASILTTGASPIVSETTASIIYASNISQDTSP